jgi:hypothetical protein
MEELETHITDGDEYKFLETKFIIFKRKQKIEKILYNIEKNK